MMDQERQPNKEDASPTTEEHPGFVTVTEYLKLRSKPKPVDPRAEKQRRYRLAKEFGITPAQWDKLYKLQKGKCPICRRKLWRPWNPEGMRAAHVDHDHITGKVRGLTCMSCNQFKIGTNTVETARNLFRYLNSRVDGRKL